MKGKINKVIHIAVLVALILTTLVLMVPSVFAAVPDEPHTGDAMWVEPSTVNLSDSFPVGYRFNVTLWINLTVASASWQFKLVYNKNYLNAAESGYTAGDKSDFYSNITTISLPFTYGSLNSTHNYVLAAESYLTGPFRSSGYGSLAWIEFAVVALPPEGEIWTSKIALVEVFPTGTETYAQDTVGTKIPLNVDHCTYIIPEFSGLLAIGLIMCLTVIAMFSRKLRSHLRHQ